jgi:predicted Zn-dependent peptidase
MSSRSNVKPWACALSLAIVSLPPCRGHAETQPIIALPAEAITLPNGLRVLLAPDAAARLVSVNVQYAAGSADDPDGLHGLAHVTEHLTFVRTVHASGLFGQLSASGASYINGTTSSDATSMSSMG